MGARARCPPPGDPFFTPGRARAISGVAGPQGEIYGVGPKNRRPPKKTRKKSIQLTEKSIQNESGPADRRNGRQTPGPLGAPCEVAKIDLMGAKNDPKKWPNWPKIARNRPLFDPFFDLFFGILAYFLGYFWKVGDTKSTQSAQKLLFNSRCKSDPQNVTFWHP